MTPFLKRLDEAKRVLIAGCGGGFDVYSGVPIGLRLMEAGKEVVFANLSFTNVWLTGGEQIVPFAWRIGAGDKELPYFPEKWLAEWLARRGLTPPVYAFGKCGARPLADAYKYIVDLHDVDLVLLVDGGTDSVIFGDEPGLGTVAEDALSLVAACAAAGDKVMLAALGFGIDHYHGVSHYSFLENVSRLIQQGGFLGAFSLTPGTPEAGAFLDLVDYANQRQPRHGSIVCNSIASALRGEFGDYHATGRTAGSQLFINPLMIQYWTFDAPSVVSNMHYADSLAETGRLEEVLTVIERERAALPVRFRRPLPL